MATIIPHEHHRHHLGRAAHHQHRNQCLSPLPSLGPQHKSCRIGPAVGGASNALAAPSSSVGNPNFAPQPASEAERGAHRKRAFKHEERVPLEIQLQIASYLDLKALIRLRCASRYWRWFIDAVKDDPLTVHPARARLLALFDEWVGSQSHGQTSSSPSSSPRGRRASASKAEVQKKRCCVPKSGFDREEYARRVTPPTVGGLPEEFDIWLREWPERAVVAGVWPALEDEDEDGGRAGKETEGSSSCCSNMLAPRTWKHSFAWPMLGGNNAPNNWVHCLLDFEDEADFLRGSHTSGTHSDRQQGLRVPLSSSRGMPAKGVRVWATAIRVQGGPKEEEQQQRSGAGQVVLLLDGAGPLNGTVQALAEDIMTHQGSDYVSLRIPRGGRDTRLCAEGWARWLSEQLAHVEGKCGDAKQEEDARAESRQGGDPKRRRLDVWG